VHLRDVAELYNPASSDRVTRSRNLMMLFDNGSTFIHLIVSPALTAVPAGRRKILGKHLNRAMARILLCHRGGQRLAIPSRVGLPASEMSIQRRLSCQFVQIIKQAL
jgi:hypothetical protein